MRLLRSALRGVGRRLVLLALLPLPAVAAPPHWPGIQIITFSDQKPAQLATLRSLGVTAGMVIANREGDPAIVATRDAPLRALGLGCYVENIATDFYSAYHRWSPEGRPVNWLFTETQKAYRADPSSMAPLIRHPSLSDPVWLNKIAQRLEAHVREMRPYHPLYYNLADEPGIADLPTFWDFDFSPDSLAAFRVWLRGNYGSLSALNAEWGTQFGSWSAVRPWTTKQATAAPPDNLAPWADFKAFMDAAFAHAVQYGADAIHHADPDARAGLEGAQVPGWGGYDYTLLSPTVDVMEIYDGRQNMALLQAFNPHVLPVVTTFRSDDLGLNVLWRGILHGARGVVLWDDDQEIVRPDGSIGPRGKQYAPVLAALRGHAGQALAAARPVYDPVAILYSPASFRIAWMNQNRGHGDVLLTSSPETSYASVGPRTALDAYAKRLIHLGLRPQYISDREIAAAPPRGVRLLILPDQVALSDAELRSLRTFVGNGGTILTDAEFGETDLHGRARAQPAKDIPALRVSPDDAAGLASALAAARIAPAFRSDVTDAEISVLRRGRHWLIGVQRDFAADGKAETVNIPLSRSMKGTELITGTAIPSGTVVRLQLGRVSPALLDLAPASER